jgi:sugar lactone lactonase YvrE
MKCANGVCENAAAACDAATCADGCCNGTTCVTATDHSSCGRGGAACVSCSSLTPLCKTGTCSAGTWANQSTFGSDGDGNDNFDQPYGIFEGDTLTTWVADSSNNRISIWTRNDNSRSWSYSAKFGGARGSGDSEFWQPKGVSVSEDRLTAWVADSNNHRISIWTRNDDKSTNWSYSTRFGKFGTGNDNFKNPSSVVVSADALTAWVADQMNDRISIWTRDDVTSTVWRSSAQFGSSGSGDSEFSGPSGIFVSSDTLTAWIADNGNSRIAIWTRSDSASTTWSYCAKFGKQGAGDSDLSNPNGVFASADSLTTWVADFGNNRISIWTRQNSASTAWTYSAKFGAQGTGGSDLWNPSGVFVSADSLTAWVSEYGNNRISVWAQG